MAAPVLQFKRGNAGVAGTVPALRPGEPAFSLNNFDLFVGFDTSVVGNKFFGSHRYWNREDGTTSLRFNLVDKDGSNYVALKTPDTLAGIVTYILPGVQGGNQTVLTNDGSGNLSWSSGSLNAVFSGITTIGGDFFDVNVDSDFAGITTFSNTTDNVLGDPNTGAVQIDGGLGVEKNVTVGAGLSVAGESYFIGTATFYGGQINLGDSDTDDINVAGEFISNLIPNTDNTYDIGDNASPKRWRHAAFSGVGTFASGAVIDSIQVGIVTDTIDTTAGNLILHSATGTVEVANRLNVIGDIDVSGNVYIGGTSVTLRAEDVFIENKDIVLGYTTSVTPNDTTANHAGVAIASTEGYPLADFSVSGVNTLPNTYKQLMWFQSGTLGFATDAFAFNYGLAIGTTTMGNGVRLAVGSGVTITDDTVSADYFNSTNQTLQAPTIGDYSGERLRLYDFNNTSNTNYAIGVEQNNIWFGVDNNAHNQGFKWYGETTQVMRLGGSGNLTIAGTLNVDGVGISTITGLLDLNGGLDVTGQTTLNNDLGVTGVSTFTGLIDANGGADIAGQVTFTNDFAVTGVSTFTGLIDANGGLDVTGQTVLNNDLAVTGVSTFTGIITATNGINAGGETTLASATVSDLTNGRVVLAGTAGSLEDSANLTFGAGGLIVGAGGINVTGVSTFSTDVVVDGDVRINGNDIKSSTGQTVITLANDDATFASDLTVQGNLYVSGNTTQVNTASLTVEDRTIDLGIVNGAAPAANTTWDLGVLFNYYTAGAAKKSAVIWEHGDARFKFASVMSADTEGSDNDTPQLTVTTFAPIEVAELWVNNSCTGGTQQVIGCLNSELQLQNITVDAGTF